MNEAVRNNASVVEPVLSPTSPDFIRNPYPFYQQLRADARMLQTPFGASQRVHIFFMLVVAFFRGGVLGAINTLIGKRR
jgi:hypothetical protein